MIKFGKKNNDKKNKKKNNEKIIKFGVINFFPAKKI